jgi:hypothetical protein
MRGQKGLNEQDPTFSTLTAENQDSEPVSSETTAEIKLNGASTNQLLSNSNSPMKAFRQTSINHFPQGQLPSAKRPLIKN